MSETNQRSTQDNWLASQSKAKPLIFKTPFIEDESLTSWIIRASLKQYCTPSTFTYYYWSDASFRIWNQDIDKGFEVSAPKIHKEIAILAECSELEVTKHTLVDFAKKINGTLYSGVALPWTTPLSKRGSYSRIGYPYCAYCMTDDEQAHLSLYWRYSWSICCSKHENYLQNQCPHCLSPYQPQLVPLELGTINRCHSCHKKIDSLISNHQITPSNLILDYQKTAIEVCKNGTGIVFGITVSTEVWFETLMFLINMARKAFVNLEHMFAKVLISLCVIKENENFIKPRAGLQFDFLNISERNCLLEHAYKLMQKTYDDWKIALNENGVTQNSFEWSKYIKIPSSFKPIYDELPIANRQRPKSKQTTVKPTPPDVVINQWSRLKRKTEMEKYYDNHKQAVASKSM